MLRVSSFFGITVNMDPFGYEMARDARYGAGLPNIGYYQNDRALELRSPPDERYELRFVQRRYARRGGVVGAGFNGSDMQMILDELRFATAPSPVDTPVYVCPKTVKRKRSRKQVRPEKYDE